MSQTDRQADKFFDTIYGGMQILSTSLLASLAGDYVHHKLVFKWKLFLSDFSGGLIAKLETDPHLNWHSFLDSYALISGEESFFFNFHLVNLNQRHAWGSKGLKLRRWPPNHELKFIINVLRCLNANNY